MTETILTESLTSLNADHHLMKLIKCESCKEDLRAFFKAENLTEEEK